MGVLTQRKITEPQKHRFDRKEYHLMGKVGIFHEDDRVELIEGDIIEMTPIGRKHAGIVNYLSKYFERHLGERVVVSTQNPIVLDEHSEPQPDLTLLKYREDYYQNKDVQPDDVYLVVEVSDSSLRYDRNTKIPLYARHGIPYVWIVDVDAKAVEVFSKPGSDGYQISKRCTGNNQLSLDDFPEFELKVKDIFK